MKKLILVMIALLSITSASAQYKSQGFKAIFELGCAVSKYSNSYEYYNDWQGECVEESISEFGAVFPGAELSLGGMVTPQIFVGIGAGYDACIGVSDFKDADTSHEGKLFGHIRAYFGTQGGVIFDIKAGYKRNFTDDYGGFDLFVGPGLMLGDRVSLSIGYAGTFYGDHAGKFNGGALKLGFEF